MQDQVVNWVRFPCILIKSYQLWIAVVLAICCSLLAFIIFLGYNHNRKRKTIHEIPYMKVTQFIHSLLNTRIQKREATKIHPRTLSITRRRAARSMLPTRQLALELVCFKMVQWNPTLNQKFSQSKPHQNLRGAVEQIEACHFRGQFQRGALGLATPLQIWGVKLSAKFAVVNQYERQWTDTWLEGTDLLLWFWLLLYVVSRIWAVDLAL